jgi:hypothetical protein
MPSVDRLPARDRALLRIEEPDEQRRKVLRYARLLPPGSKKKQHRQIALSPGHIFSDAKRLASNMEDG